MPQGLPRSRRRATTITHSVVKPDRAKVTAWRSAAPALALGALIGAGAAGGLALPVRALADDAVDAPTASTNTTTPASPSLEAVVVTARRRDEKLQDVPLAETVESGAQLKEQDAVLFDDVGRLLPNVRMVASPQSVSALDVTIRGQTVNRSAITFDPAVGLYVDGVYVANGQAAMSTLLDIDTVEIVRGAQGTLFGRNNTGGSISFHTNRPQLDTYSAEVAGAVGSDRMFMGRGIVNLPLGDTAAVRVAFQDNQREGYGSSVGDGQDDFENQHRYQVRIGGLWRPSDAFNAYMTYEHFDAKEAGALVHPLAGPSPGTTVAQIGAGIALEDQQFGLPYSGPRFPSDLYQTDAGFPSHDDSSLDATQLTLTQALGESILAKLILGFRHLSNDTAIDIDASVLPLADTTLTNTSNQASAELQLSGTALDKRVDWVGGLYWFHDQGSAPSDLEPDTLEGAPRSLEQNSARNVSTAGFVHGEYHIDERWSAAAGVRRTDDKRELSDNIYYVTPFGESCEITGTTAGLACPPIDKQANFSYWSWELSTRYRISEQLNAYFRNGRAQRSGGWNTPISTVDAQPFKPEQLTDYELGLKADLLDHTLLVNGDVFDGNYDNMQRLLAQQFGNSPTTTVINAGRARVGGAELEASWRAVQPLWLQTSFGWTDARYRQFEYTPIPGGPALNLAGNEFYQTPKLNAGVAGTYTWALPSGNVRLHADYAWQDSVQFNVINDFNHQGAYGTLNGRATFASQASTWEFALFGTNLAGRKYAFTGGTILSANRAPPPLLAPNIAWQIPGAPRMYGLEVTYRFERPG